MNCNPTSCQRQGWTWQGLWFTPQSNIVSRVVVAFHGFGRPMEEMGNYLPLFDEATAMLSIGLCHHNGSTAPEGKDHDVLSPERFHRAIEGWLGSLLPENHTEVAKELLGYSLGGRIALTLFEHAPETWSGIRLLAPDGFRKNPMYRFAVETHLGRMTWAWTNRHAHFVRKVIRGLRRLRFIPAHLEHFALHHTENEAMRTLVARTWRTHREFWPTMNGTKKAWGTLEQRGAHVYAVFGERDAIIPWAWSKPWRQQAPKHVHFMHIDAGHVMRHHDTVERIAEAILTTSHDES